MNKSPQYNHQSKSEVEGIHGSGRASQHLYLKIGFHARKNPKQHYL